MLKCVICLLLLQLVNLPLSNEDLIDKLPMELLLRYSTVVLNSTENYGRRCLTPLSPHRNYILS